MEYSQFREMVFGRVYGLPAWAWTGIMCLLVVGVALFPVPVAFTDDRPQDAEKVGSFTDGKTNSSATVTYEISEREKDGITVYRPSTGSVLPDVEWDGGQSGMLHEKSIVSYNAESGVFYQSVTTRLTNGRVWNHTVWGDSDEVYHRVEWTDGMRDVEEYRSSHADNNTDVVVLDTGPTTTIITKTQGNFSVDSNNWWRLKSSPWTGLDNAAPYVSPSGNLVTGSGVEGGDVQVTDEPGVSYSASFDYTYVAIGATEGLQGVYGDSYVPLIVQVFLSTTDIHGELNRTPGASGIPKNHPDWTTMTPSENSSG